MIGVNLLRYMLKRGNSNSKMYRLNKLVGYFNVYQSVSNSG